MDSDGQQGWENTDIAANASAVVTGNSQIYILAEEFQNGQNWYVASFSPAGNLNWQTEVEQQYLFGAPFGLTTDGQGDVYGVARKGGLLGAGNPFLFKLDPNGNMLWQTQLSINPDANDKVIAQNGYVYVVGEPNGSGNNPTVQVIPQETGKVAATWAPGSDYIEQVVVDPSGNMFIQSYNKVLEFNHSGKEINQITLDIHNFMGIVQPILLWDGDINAYWRTQGLISLIESYERRRQA